MPKSVLVVRNIGDIFQTECKAKYFLGKNVGLNFFLIFLSYGINSRTVSLRNTSLNSNFLHYSKENLLSGCFILVHVTFRE